MHAYPEEVEAGPDGSSKATAAMVVGITGLVLAFLPVIGLLTLITSPVGIFLGISGLKSAKRGQAIAGIVMGSIAFFLNLLITIAAITAFAAVGEAIQQDFEQSAYEAQSNK
jgi:hypothetical protein